MLEVLLKIQYTEMAVYTKIFACVQVLRRW